MNSKYIEEEYRKAFKELLIILEYIPQSDYEKIPKELIETFKKNADNSYPFEIDTKKDLKEQKISEITKALLENLYRDYWVTKSEKKSIIEEEYKEKLEIEKEKTKSQNNSSHNHMFD